MEHHGAYQLGHDNNTEEEEVITRLVILLSETQIGHLLQRRNVFSPRSGAESWCTVR